MNAESNRKSNIVLIGMPSSGKSTVGEYLAGSLDKGFVDTDSIITQKVNKPLRDVVNQDGLAVFLRIQEEAVLELDLSNHVIATGGSVVYGNASMEHLRRNGFIIYLKIGLDEVIKRAAPERRFARDPGKSLGDMFAERSPLYERYADVTIECTGKSIEDIASKIITWLKKQVDSCC